jgi:hypothetical protein
MSARKTAENDAKIRFHISEMLSIEMPNIINSAGQNKLDDRLEKALRCLN